MDGSDLRTGCRSVRRLAVRSSPCPTNYSHSLALVGPEERREFALPGGFAGRYVPRRTGPDEYVRWDDVVRTSRMIAGTVESYLESD